VKGRALQNKWWLLLLLLPIGWGLSRLRLDTQVLNLLPAELTSVQGLKLYEEHFANANELLVALKGEEPAELERAAREIAEQLRARSNIVSSAVWTPPWEEHPGETAELMAYLWLNQPPEIFLEFVSQFAAANISTVLEESKSRLANSLSPEEIARMSYDPFGFLNVPGEGAASFGSGESLFSSSDGKFRIIFVQAREPLKGFKECQDFVARVQESVGEWQRRSGAGKPIAINYTGRPAFVTEISSHMQQDIEGSVGGTLLIIAGLFWWAHRRVKPLLWLVFLLMVILATTLALGGILFGKLNIITVGFAAILLGLAVDYGLVLYQEWISASGESKQAIRRAVAPSIIWSSITTLAAFLTLNLSGLPGLAQLGTLVGIGIGVGAAVMLMFFLAPFQETNRPIATHAPGDWRRWEMAARVLTAIVVVLGVFVVIKPPRVNGGAEALRPAASPAYSTLDEIKRQFRRLDEPLWLLARGPGWDEVGRKLDVAKERLEAAKKSGWVTDTTLPGALSPRPDRQRLNLREAKVLAGRNDELNRAVLEAGFTTNSIGLMGSVLNVWRAAAESGKYYMPRQMTGKWVVQRLISDSAAEKIALGIVQPSAEGERRQDWMQAVAKGDLLLASWEEMGAQVFGVVKREAWLVGIPMGLLVLVSLVFAFKEIKPILFSLFSLLLAGIILSTVMIVRGWEWNLMNLMALPLLLGTGLDYSLHVQLALRRHGHNVGEMRCSVGRALFLCAATTITGFGSLAWAGNAGLASLGKICAVGIAAAYFVAVWLLPSWSRTGQAAK
jgi:uncharacterized protein